MRLGLSAEMRAQSAATLNRLLAHTMAMRDLYRKAHWQTSGATFYELHQLFDANDGAQLGLIDELAGRVQMQGGIALALVNAHEMILVQARPLALGGAEGCDDGSNDLIISQVVGTNEKQSWFVSEHLAMPRARHAG